ncbi:MAG TPA: DUF6064 family protein [Balneolales bacterium]|nr:DUF6064 family protein [Balneolales bacterium]
MNIPFTIHDFLQVFGVYNKAIEPIQIIAYLLGITALFLLYKGTKRSSKFVNAILGLFWIWIGFAYHIHHFSTINKAAYIFGVLFIIQGLIFLYMSFSTNDIIYTFDKKFSNIIGVLFLLYAMIIYPIFNVILGHSYPYMPVFGVAPCPTTIFTFALLLMIQNKVPYFIMAIPVLWSIIGLSASINLGISEDYGLAVAGILSVFLIPLHNRNFSIT